MTDGNKSKITFEINFGGDSNQDSNDKKSIFCKY